jgi:hypothetical protein
MIVETTKPTLTCICMTCHKTRVLHETSENDISKHWHIIHRFRRKKGVCIDCFKKDKNKFNPKKYHKEQKEFWEEIEKEVRGFKDDRSYGIIKATGRTKFGYIIYINESSTRNGNINDRGKICKRTSDYVDKKYPYLDLKFGIMGTIKAL